MFELSVKNDRGDILDFKNNDKYVIYKIEGLAPPKATISSSSNTTTDGTNISSVRLEKRNIVIYVAINGDIEANRIGIYKYFPVKKNITLYFKNGSRDVYINGVVELIECDLFSNRQVAQISIICPRVYFKDVNALISQFSDVSALFTFPFAISSNGIEFSAITTNVRKKIVNYGDAPTGAVIKLFAIGTVENPVIYDVLKRTHIKLNYTMQASDTIVINTNVGEKSITLIRSGVSSNLLGYMALSSEWLTLEAGDNVFTYDCESGNSSLQITFTTEVLYSGV